MGLGLVTVRDCESAIDQQRTLDEIKDTAVTVWFEKGLDEIVWGIEGDEQSLAVYLLRHRLDRNYDLPKEDLE